MPRFTIDDREVEVPAGSTILDAARKLSQQGKVRRCDRLSKKDTVAVVSEALAHLGSYHRRPALSRRGDRLFHGDRSLLLYYQNRLSGFGGFGMESKP